MSRIIVLFLSVMVFAIGCSGEKEPEQKVSVQTSDSEIVISADSGALAEAGVADKQKDDSMPSLMTRGNFTIQIGAFRTETRAHEAIVKYRAMGYNAYLEEATVGAQDQVWFRVRIGRFVDRNDADAVIQELNEKGGTKAWIDKINR